MVMLQSKLITKGLEHTPIHNINTEGENPVKISARNVFKGTVKQLTHGAVNSEVVILLPGGVEVVSIITKHSAEALELVVGKEVYAVIKASDVMVGDPHVPKS
jgi:molybdopterin-binding protein